MAKEMMPEIKYLPKDEDVDDLKDDARTVWVGAISFEPRCVGGLNDLVRRGRHLSKGIFLRYPAGRSASQSYIDLVCLGEQRLENAAEQIFPTKSDVIQVSPYSTAALEGAFSHILTVFSPKTVIVDITCFTKLHTIALANFVSEHIDAVNWVFQYTKPDNYGKLDDATLNKWSDVLIAPISPDAVLGNEETTRGVIITGFEPHRTMVALGEVEPTGGTVLIGKVTGRPDQAKLSAQRHRKLVNRLSLQDNSWEVIYSDIFDFKDIKRVIDSEISHAETLSAPIFVYPFGPKPIVFASCYYLVAQYAKSAWFAYTTPELFDVEYSEGIGATDWFCLRS